MALRWGIASAGKISNDFVNAIKGLPQEEHQVVAVAARSIASAKEFAKSHDIPKFYKGYDNLAKDENVQVVYIGTLNPQHYVVTKMMLENGKHVLCEKPFALNQKQAKELIELAKSKNLFLMEAVWSRFFPVYQEVKQLVDSGEIGDIRFVTVDFGFKLDEVERVSKKDLGGSAILDIGIYVLQFQQFFYKGLTPERVVVGGHLNDDGVDDVASVIFDYPGGKSAVVSCNVTAQMPNEGVIVGTKGTIKIPLFWCPEEYELNGKVKKIPLIPNDRDFNYTNSEGLAYQAIEVRKQILNKKIESEIMPHQDTLQLAAWMDLVRKEIGVVFPQDSQ